MKYSMRYRVANLAKKLGVDFDPKKSPELMAMKEEITALPDGIQFRITTEPNGDWMAESVNIDGILTGGDARDNVDEMIKDAIFTYYGVTIVTAQVTVI